MLRYNEINRKKRLQIIPTNTLVGIQICFKQNGYESQELVTQLDAEKFRIKHQVTGNLEQIVNKMIEHFNKTLRYGEYPRKVICMFNITESFQYTKIVK